METVVSPRHSQFLYSNMMSDSEDLHGNSGGTHEIPCYHVWMKKLFPGVTRVKV